jgi:hypothetical protein
VSCGQGGGSPRPLISISYTGAAEVSAVKLVTLNCKRFEESTQHNFSTIVTTNYAICPTPFSAGHLRPCPSKDSDRIKGQIEGLSCRTSPSASKGSAPFYCSAP